jgi:sugar diacid utilization regulator
MASGPLERLSTPGAYATAIAATDKLVLVRRGIARFLLNFEQRFISVRGITGRDFMRSI